MMGGGINDTRLLPKQPAREGGGKAEITTRPRRNSTGGLIEGRTADIIPFELIKRPVRPPTAPLASQDSSVLAHTS